MTGPTGAGGFQNIVNDLPPPGVAGDFAGANPRATATAPAGGFNASAAGVKVGAFAYADPATGIARNAVMPNSVFGFVHREMNALVTAFLGYAASVINQGLRVTLFTQGDFLATFTAGASVGQKVYADPVTGLCTAAATGGSVTATLTAGGASIASSVLTTTDSTVTGTLAVGQLVTASGGSIPPGTYILSSGGTGSGTHIWNLANVDGTVIPDVTAGSLTWILYGVQETPWYVQSAVPVDASVTASIAAPVSPAVTGIMTVTTLGSGLLAPGQWLTGTNLSSKQANVQILSQLTATTPSTGGGTGTYLTTYAGSAAVTSGTLVGTMGKLARISSWGNAL